MFVQNRTAGNLYFPGYSKERIRGFNLTATGTAGSIHYVPDTTWSATEAMTLVNEGKIAFVAGPNIPTNLVAPAAIPSSIVLELIYNTSIAAKTLTIDGVVFTFSSSSTATGLNVYYGTNGATLAANLKAAINAYASAHPSFTVNAKDISGGGSVFNAAHTTNGAWLTLVALEEGAFGTYVNGASGTNTHTLLLGTGASTYIAMTNTLGAAATQLTGGAGSTQVQLFTQTQVVPGTATDITFVTGFTTITSLFVSIVTTGGALVGNNVTYADQAIVAGGTVTIPYVTADSPKMTAGDIITVLALGF